MIARCQVDDEYGTATVLIDHDVTDQERRLLDPLLEALTDQERLHLLTHLIRQKADEEAYARVCRERGLLL